MREGRRLNTKQKEKSNATFFFIFIKSQFLFHLKNSSNFVFIKFSSLCLENWISIEACICRTVRVRSKCQMFARKPWRSCNTYITYICINSHQHHFLCKRKAICIRRSWMKRLHREFYTQLHIVVFFSSFFFFFLLYFFKETWNNMNANKQYLPDTNKEKPNKIVSECKLESSSSKFAEIQYSGKWIRFTNLNTQHIWKM